MAPKLHGRSRGDTLPRTPRADVASRASNQRRADIYERLAIAIRERRAPKLSLARAKGGN